MGSCILKIPHIANLVIENWKYFHQKKYLLTAYVVMPNHVHVLINTNKNIPLGDIVHSWKSFTSKKISEFLQSAPVKNRGEIIENPGWQLEYWDRYIRDENHYVKAIDYIHYNPVKAGLCKEAKDWPFSSFNSHL